MRNNLPCPACREQGRDKMGDHLFLMQDGETYTCRTQYHPRKFYTYDEGSGEAVPKKRHIMQKETLEDVLNYPFVDFDYRGIKDWVYRKFLVRYSVDQKRGEPEVLYFPVKDNDGNLIGYHYRNIHTKTISNTTTFGDTRLFGNYEVGKIAVITEGHFDALSIYQVLKKKYSKFEPCIYSVNNGSTDIKSITNTLEILKKYEKVILCFDKDIPGDKLTDQAAKILGSKAYEMDLGKYKDANEALQDDSINTLLTGFFKASPYRPSGVISLASIAEDIITPVEMGLTYPFEGLDRITYGLRKDCREIISIAAAPGGGKSCLMTSFIKHLIFEHKEKISLFALEESPIITGKKLIGNIINKSMHIPDCVYDPLHASEILEMINDYVYLFDHQGSKSWEDIENVIRYQSTFGIRFFIIDPLTALSAHLTSGEANEMLNKMLADLSTLVNALGITVFLVSHLNNAKSGVSHEEGGKVKGSEFTGSRAVWRWSTLMLGLSRNLLSDDEKERNTSTLSVIKNRFSGDLGSIKLFYDKSTAMLEELVPNVGEF